VDPEAGKQKEYPNLILTVIHAQEWAAIKGRERIDWKLLTDLPVRSRQEAIEKLTRYAQRWKIESFHKILKSGCKVGGHEMAALLQPCRSCPPPGTTGSFTLDQTKPDESRELRTCAVVFRFWQV
jgi:hypothetical protein